MVLGPFVVLGPSSLLASTMRACGAMGVYRFEDLRVWQAAKRQCDRV